MSDSTHTVLSGKDPNQDPFLADVQSKARRNCERLGIKWVDYPRYLFISISSLVLLIAGFTALFYTINWKFTVSGPIINFLMSGKYQSLDLAFFVAVILANYPAKYGVAWFFRRKYKNDNEPNKAYSPSEQDPKETLE